MTTLDTNQLALDYLGRLLMERVRDNAIVGADQIFKRHSQDENSTPSLEAAQNFTSEQMSLVTALIPLVVDNTLGLLLNLLDADTNLRLEVRTEVGVVANIRDASEDLNLEIYNWIEQFSKQRFIYSL